MVSGAARRGAELVTSEPERFFAPTPSGSGVFGDWIVVYLDTEGELAVDWQEVAAIIQEAYRLRAPKASVAGLNPPRPPPSIPGALPSG